MIDNVQNNIELYIHSSERDYIHSIYAFTQFLNPLWPTETLNWDFTVQTL
jgi:hypothetical protein